MGATPDEICLVGNSFGNKKDMIPGHNYYAYQSDIDSNIIVNGTGVTLRQEKSSTEMIEKVARLTQKVSL